MELYTPKFLNHVRISRADLKRIAPKLKNWETVIKSYTRVSLDELEKYILIELNFKCRQSYLERMLARYNKLKEMRVDRDLSFNDNSQKPFYKIVEDFQ